MYHDSYFTSLLTNESFFLICSFYSNLKGSSGFPNFSMIAAFANLRVMASTDNSTIYSQLVRFATLSVDPSILPGKNVL